MMCFSVFLLFYLFPLNCCYEIFNLTWSQALLQGKNLVSPYRIFELGFFSPNNSVNQYVGIWYKHISPQKVVWVANRENPLAVTDSNASLIIGSNGNLNLVDGNKRSVIWSTDIDVPSNTSVAELTDYGNFLLKDVISGDILWQSFDHLGDTLLPLSAVGFNVKTGERHVLTSWKSETDPSPGNFTLGISPQRPTEAFIWVNGSTPHWRSGPWDKSKFIGILGMQNSSFKLEEDAEQGTTTLSATLPGFSIKSYLSISSDGVISVMNQMEGTDWILIWEAPLGSCEAYGVCGPFAVCKTFESPICSCLKGFEPKSNEEWKKGNWKGGCIRQTKLLCDTNTSSSPSSGGRKTIFWKMGNAKLPDLYECVQLGNAYGCEKWCQSNCSCLAYAFVHAIGCLVWSKDLVDIQQFPYDGEDLFIRLADSELAGGQKMKNFTIILIAISTGSILGAIVFTWYCCRANRKGNIEDDTQHFNLVETNDISRDALQSAVLHDPSELSIFDFHTILVATNQFSISNKIGQGGFGPVYKGKLHDGKDIAVKRLSSSSGQGAEEFKNEMILISKLQHRNLVRLLGCCAYKEEKLLIYEFMPNKSLDTFLFDSERRSELNWATRFNIIQGVARGLLYLHRDSCLRVIHRDLKASNILLDEKMNPKISDFGLARIFQETIDLANTRRVVGTFGYMSPEYVLRGMFSEKSDVYSFGVLLLELVSGKKNNSFQYCDQQLSLNAHAWQLWNECRVLDLMDEALADSYSSSEVVRCIEVGLLCAQDHPTDRPNMREVVIMLSNETDRIKPKKPYFTFPSSLIFDPQPQSGTKFSTNEATMSMIEGR